MWRKSSFTEQDIDKTNCLVRKKCSKEYASRVIPFLGGILLLLLWQILSETGLVNRYVLPSPDRVFQVFMKMLLSGELLRDIGISFGRVLKGYGISLLLAFFLGSVRIFFPGSARIFDGNLQFMRNVPPIAMMPLLILWFGIGEKTKTVIIVLASFFPVYLSIVKGFISVDEKLIEVGKAFGYSTVRSFWHITLPAAMPDILVGCRTGLGYAWRAIIGAEMIAASSGLGYRILFSQQMARTDKVIVGILAIGTVGILTDLLMGICVNHSLKGVARHGWE